MVCDLQSMQPITSPPHSHTHTHTHTYTHTPNIQPAHTHFHYQVGLMSVFSEYVRSLYHSGWCDYVAMEHPAVYISSFQRRSYERNSQQMFVLSCALVL